MKCLIVFLATLLAVCSTAFAAPCADIQGTWRITGSMNNPILYVCTQTNGVDFNCSVTQLYGNAQCKMTYTGNFDGIADFLYTATYVSGTCGTTFPFSGIMQVTGTGCTQLGDNGGGPNAPTTWPYYRTAGLNSVSLETLGGFAIECELPGTVSGSSSANGEGASTWEGWLADSPPRGTWIAALNDAGDSNFKFSGRDVDEAVSISGNTNGNPSCPAVSLGPGSHWYPDPTHNWSVGWDGVSDPDGVGFSNTAGTAEFPYPGYNYVWDVQRGGAAFPCSITITQSMRINCPVTGSSTQVEYENHPNVITMNDGSVTVCRHGNCHTENWGLKRAVWRWLDLILMPVFFLD